MNAKKQEVINLKKRKKGYIIIRLYNVIENVFQMVIDYTAIASEARYREIKRKDVQTLRLKKILHTLPKSLAQVKPGNTLKDFLNEIIHIIQLRFHAYFLIWASKNIQRSSAFPSLYQDFYKLDP